MEYYAVKVHYYDASALVKLVAEDSDEEPGRDILRKYHHEHGSRYTTSFCIAEAFGAFKSKFLRKKINQDQYIKSIKGLIRLIGNTFKIDELPTLSPIVNAEFERLTSQYNLDFIDCFQIVTIKHGKYRIFDGSSQSILITADRELAKIARAEKARVWECTTEPSPPPN